MAKHNTTGEIGEEIAHFFLQDKGYMILASNWRWGHAEIDIIAQKGNILTFIEVKTRENLNFGPPELAVTPAKQNRIYHAAVEYMFQHAYEEEFRFDILAIVLEPELSIIHFEDAFFPIWE